MIAYKSVRRTLVDALCVALILVLGVVMGLWLADLLQPIRVEVTPVPAPSLQMITKIMEAMA